MNITRAPKFKKSFKERIVPSSLLVNEFQEALNLFLDNATNPILKDHPLTKEKSGLRSFSVTDDIRVVYRKTKDGILLYDIGTHKQVY